MGNKIKIKKDYLEYAFLIIYVTAFCYYGIGEINSHKVVHDIPQGYMANDPYQAHNFMLSIGETGSLKYFHYSLGFNLTNMAWFQPPIPWLGPVLTGDVMGLEYFDSNNIMLMLLMCFSSLLMYYIIRKENKNIAILSLPLSFFMFFPNFIFSIIWGRYAILVTGAFIVLLIRLLFDLRKKNVWILIGLILAIIGISHTYELLYALGFYGLFLLLMLKKKEFKHKELIWLTFKIGIVAFIFFIYQFSVMYMALKEANPSSFIESITAAEIDNNRYPSVQDLKFTMWLIIPGALLYLFLKNKTSFFFGLYFLLLGFTNFIIGRRALEMRFLWPILCGIFFGLAIYQILVLLKQNKNMLVSIIISVILSIYIISMLPAGLGQGTFISKDVYDSFVYVREKTPEQSSVLVHYGEGFSQTSAYGTMQRLSFRLGEDEMVKFLQNRHVDRDLHTYWAGEGLSFGAYKNENKEWQYLLHEGTNRYDIRDYCNFNYYLYTKVGRVNELLYFNNMMITKMLENDYVIKEFENQQVIILKNNKPGQDCIPAEGFDIEV